MFRRKGLGLRMGSEGGLLGMGQETGYLRKWLTGLRHGSGCLLQEIQGPACSAPRGSRACLACCGGTEGGKIFRQTEQETSIAEQEHFFAKKHTVFENYSGRSFLQKSCKNLARI